MFVRGEIESGEGDGGTNGSTIVVNNFVCPGRRLFDASSVESRIASNALRMQQNRVLDVREWGSGINSKKIE